MTTNRSMTDVSIARVAGIPLDRFRLGVALAALVLVGLSQTGCRSDGCSTCGGFGSKLTNDVRALGARVFNHKDQGGCSTCGTLGAEPGVIVDSGIPIVAPGAIALPAPGTVVSPPSIESQPTNLEPIIPAPTSGGGSGSAAATGRNQTGANRSAYEASNSKNTSIASKRGTDLSRAYESSSTPTQTAYAPEEPDVLDHLPPVDLYPELSRKVTPLKKSVDSSATNPSPDDELSLPSSPPAVVPSAESNPKTSSAENNSAGDRLILPKPSSPIGSVRASPGMVRSASVAPSIAGGSLPSVEGLAWLKEKGYRTLVDLRGRYEVDPEFAELVNDNGMLYVAIPFSIKPLNLSRLSRFNELLAQADQKPLYFFDNDGRRAGLLWYLRLRSKDHEEIDSARSKAEEIGFLATDLDQAENFLKLNFALEVQPDVPAVLTSEHFSSIEVSQPIELPAPMISRLELAPIRSNPTATFASLEQKGSWKPITALVLSGLGVPLAYWSGSTLFQRRLPRRASLTAKLPEPRKSLPSSGV